MSCTTLHLCFNFFLASFSKVSSGFPKSVLQIKGLVEDSHINYQIYSIVQLCVITVLSA